METFNNLVHFRGKFLLVSFLLSDLVSDKTHRTDMSQLVQSTFQAISRGNCTHWMRLKIISLS
jgi:hypothetical protein